MIDRGTFHVYPVNDTIAHDTDGGTCICGTTTEPVEREDGTYGWVEIHHALDGREFTEHDYTGKPMRVEP